MSAKAATASSKRSSDGMNMDSWGTEGYLTTDQFDALNDFKSKAEENDLTMAKFSAESVDSVCLRFLRARQFSVPKALALLSECIQKKMNGKAAHYACSTADECTKCDVRALQKWYPHAYLGFDKLNRPIIFEASGRVAQNAILQMTTFDNMISYHWWMMDTALDRMFTELAERKTVEVAESPRATAAECATKKTSDSANAAGVSSNGSNISGDGGTDSRPAQTVTISTLAILDFAGLTMSHCSSTILNHMKALVSIDNSCYPEVLGKMFVINAPWIAVTTWEIVRRWLDPRTQAKVEILGSGPEVQQRLLEVVDAEVLPQCYGGTAPDPVEHSLRASPHAELVMVPRHGAVKKTVDVPPGHRLVVDSYVTDGELLLEVFSSDIVTTLAEGVPGRNQGDSSSSISGGTTSISSGLTKGSSGGGGGGGIYGSAATGEFPGLRKHPPHEILVNHTSGAHSANLRPIPGAETAQMRSKLMLKRPEGQTEPLRVKLVFEAAPVAAGEGKVCSAGEGEGKGKDVVGTSFTALWSNKSSYYSRPLVFNMYWEPVEPSKTASAAQSVVSQATCHATEPVSDGAEETLAPTSVGTADAGAPLVSA